MITVLIKLLVTASATAIVIVIIKFLMRLRFVTLNRKIQNDYRND